MSWVFVDGQVQKVYAVTGILPGTSATATAYKISSVSASSCVLSFSDAVIVNFFCINVTNWFTVNATNEAVQQISTGFALAFIDNHLLPSILMILVRLRWHRLLTGIGNLHMRNTGTPCYGYRPSNR